MRRTTSSGPSGSLVKAGGRLSRDTGIYTIGMSFAFPLSLISVAVVTRFLNPADYGRLGILFVFAGFLTTFYNLGTLHGTFMYVFGMGEGGDAFDADVGDTDDTRPGSRATNDVRALGTGLVMTVLVVSTGTVIVMLLAPTLALALIGDRSSAHLVRWAALSAASGSVWRLNVNLFRMERRPVTYGVMTLSRPIFVLGATIGSLIAGLRTEGPLVGTTVGTLASVVAMMALSRRSWTVGFHLDDAKMIARYGARFLGVTVAMWVIHNADLLFLSNYASAHQVGLYRLASRFASIPSYFVSAFLMAWSPLERTPVLQAAYADDGAGRVKGLLFLYYFVFASFIVVALGIVANLLVLVAAPGYRSAAPLIAVIGASSLAYGAFLVMARVARIRRKALVYNILAIGASVGFCLLALVLVPWLGAYGAALTGIIPMSVAACIFLALIQRSSQPIDFPYRRVFAAATLATGVYGVALLTRGLPRGWQAAEDVVLLALLPLLLVATGAIPRRHVARLTSVARAAIGGGGHTNAMLERLPLATSAERIVLRALLQERQDPAEFSAQTGVPMDLVGARLVRGLRQLAQLGMSRPDDSLVGRALLADVTSVGRDAIYSNLIEHGLPPLELHEIERAYKTLQGLPARRWPNVSAGTSPRRHRLTSRLHGVRS